MDVVLDTAQERDHPVGVLADEVGLTELPHLRLESELKSGQGSHLFVERLSLLLGEGSRRPDGAIWAVAGLEVETVTFQYATYVLDVVVQREQPNEFVTDLGALLLLHFAPGREALPSGPSAPPSTPTATIWTPAFATSNHRSSNHLSEMLFAKVAAVMVAASPRAAMSTSTRSHGEERTSLANRLTAASKCRRRARPAPARRLRPVRAGWAWCMLGRSPARHS